MTAFSLHNINQIVRVRIEECPETTRYKFLSEWKIFGYTLRKAGFYEDLFYNNYYRSSLFGSDYKFLEKLPEDVIYDKESDTFHYNHVDINLYFSNGCSKDMKFNSKDKATEFVKDLVNDKANGLDLRLLD